MTVNKFCAILFVVVLVGVIARPVLAQTDEELRELGEQMMDLMMGESHEDFNELMFQENGEEFTNEMHETMGRMSQRSNMGSSGMTSMMGMMSGLDSDASGMMSGLGSYSSGMMGTRWGGASLFGWVWWLIWTVNSVLIGILLWRLIQKHAAKK